MAGKWRELPFFNEAVVLNPPVELERSSRYPFVDMTAVSSVSRWAYATEERELSGVGSRFRHGDTLMASITPCLENGKIVRFFAQQGSEVGHGSTEFIVVRGRPCVTDTEFVYYLTRWEGFRNCAIGQMMGTSGRQRVPTESLSHFDVPIPPLPEQRAIAHILGTLDDKIELNRKMSQTLEQMARALFKAWFVDFEPVGTKMEGRWRRGESLPGLPAHLYDLFPDRLVDSELGEIPERLRMGRLGDVSEHPRRAVRPEEIKPGTPYIALEHMPRRSIALSEWGTATRLERNKFEFKKGEILFRKLRPYFHKVGVAPVDGVCSTDIVVVTPRRPLWFGFVLGHLSSVEFVEYTSAGSTGTKMPRTSWTDMARYNVTLPPDYIADPFTRLVQPLIERILANIHESRALAALRNALLPKLINGEIRVKEAERFVRGLDDN